MDIIGEQFRIYQRFKKTCFTIEMKFSMKMFIVQALFVQINCKIRAPLYRESSSQSFVRNSLNCMLNFYENYMNIDNMHPGSMIIVNLVTSYNSEYQNLFLKQLANLEKNYYHSTVKIQTANSKLNSSYVITTKTAKYVLFVWYARDVEKNILHWKSKLSWNPMAPIFVILRTLTPKRQTQFEINRIFKILHKYDMWRMFIVSTNFDDGNIFIQTWYPYDDEHCGYQIDNIKEIEICSFLHNQHQNSSMPSTNRKVFIDLVDWQKKWSLNNMNKCSLEVVANLYPPFAIHNNNTFSKNPTDMYSGVEIFVVNLIAYTLNMTLRIHPDRKNRNGKVRRIIDDILSPIFNG